MPTTPLVVSRPVVLFVRIPREIFTFNVWFGTIGSGPTASIIPCRALQHPESCDAVFLPRQIFTFGMLLVLASIGPIPEVLGAGAVPPGAYCQTPQCHLVKRRGAACLIKYIALCTPPRFWLILPVGTAPWAGGIPF